MPYPANGRQTPAFGVCSDACLAQELVAGLEGPSGQNVRLQCQKLLRI